MYLITVTSFLRHFRSEPTHNSFKQLFSTSFQYLVDSDDRRSIHAENDGNIVVLTGVNDDRTEEIRVDDGTRCAMIYD